MERSDIPIFIGKEIEELKARLWRVKSLATQKSDVGEKSLGELKWENLIFGSWNKWSKCVDNKPPVPRRTIPDHCNGVWLSYCCNTVNLDDWTNSQSCLGKIGFAFFQHNFPFGRMNGNNGTYGTYENIVKSINCLSKHLAAGEPVGLSFGQE